MSLEETIKTITQELLAKMDFEAEVKISQQGSYLLVEINPFQEKETAFLIGSKGAHLESLQYLLRSVVSKKMGQFCPLVLNIGSYRQQQEASLRRWAVGLATKVKLTKRAEILPAMPAAKRRIVHLAISEIEGVETESIGEGSNRRVMIKPKEKAK